MAPKTPTVGDLIDQYEIGGRTRGLAPTQLNALKPIRRGLGVCKPFAITPAVVASYVACRRKGLFTNAHAKLPAADGTIRRELGALSAVLNWAYDKRLLKDRPPTIDLPPASPPRNVFLSREEADKLWAYAEGVLAQDEGHPVRPAALFTCLALDTWARADAIETLTWGRVDLTGRPDVIDYRDPAKPETSKRRVPVPVSPRLEKVLWGPYLRADNDDAPVVGRITQYAWEKFKAAAGVRPEVTRHDLRRTGISLALARGVDPLKVAQAAGDDLATIMKHYAHFMPDYLEGLHEEAA